MFVETRRRGMCLCIDDSTRCVCLPGPQSPSIIRTPKICFHICRLALCCKYPLNANRFVLPRKIPVEPLLLGRYDYGIIVCRIIVKRPAQIYFLFLSFQISIADGSRSISLNTMKRIAPAFYIWIYEHPKNICFVCFEQFSVDCVERLTQPDTQLKFCESSEWNENFDDSLATAWIHFIEKQQDNINTVPQLVLHFYSHTLWIWWMLCLDILCSFSLIVEHCSPHQNTAVSTEIFILIK